MDLNQTKLTKSEWDSIETQVSESEKKILNVIIQGYGDINYKYNDNQSLIQLLKLNIEDTSNIEAYFYNEYFRKNIQKIYDTITLAPTKSKKSAPSTTVSTVSNPIAVRLNEWLTENKSSINNIKKIKKVDLIRIERTESTILTNRDSIFEFILLDFCEKVLLSLARGTSDYGFYLYTIIHIREISVHKINRYVMNFVEFVIRIGNENTNIQDVFRHSYPFIEKNKYLLKYADVHLFTHQKQLFSTFKQNPAGSKLVLYMAPTGTGKTLSPIGLSQQYKIIFICVARHVGLALAKSAISVGKKVAFAFGCDTASDIRLHYFSALSYTKHKKSGGIYKVDNSIGTNVEIMICDVKSYITAMHYMLAFNQEENIITYWDEPTITMDYAEHPLHETIHNNWVENRISKVVLSCATLPKEHEIVETISDFRIKFENAEIYTITSYDCKKTISILNKNSEKVLPHNLFPQYSDLLQCINYSEENKTLLRYYDLKEIVRFIEYVNENKYINEPYTVATYFNKISDITMNSIKMLYLETLKRIEPFWPIIYHNYCLSANTNTTPDNGIKKIKSIDVASTSTPSFIGAELSRTVSEQCKPSPQPSSAGKGVLITTSDAYTLTDGPTIFLTEDVQKLGRFYIQQSHIPERVFNDIMKKIGDNDVIQKNIRTLEATLEDILGDNIDKEKKSERILSTNDSVRILQQIEVLQSQIKIVNMDSIYIPNMRQHQMKWAPGGQIVENAFIPHIDDMIVKDIMLIDVDNQMKMLLLLGIGVFTNHPNIQYMEIMKKLAMNQQLYLIIAESDYIYGTNYQFCHGFIGKDLMNMTQQKTIQAMGRIGRNNIQQEYTIRFRDDAIIMNLFRPTCENLEATNMSRLFSS